MHAECKAELAHLIRAVLAVLENDPDSIQRPYTAASNAVAATCSDPQLTRLLQLVMYWPGDAGEWADSILGK